MEVLNILELDAFYSDLRVLEFLCSYVLLCCERQVWPDRGRRIVACVYQFAVTSAHHQQPKNFRGAVAHGTQVAQVAQVAQAPEQPQLVNQNICDGYAYKYDI